jgi:hypothetical protein
MVANLVLCLGYCSVLQSTPQGAVLRGALSIWQESEHSENFSRHCGNVVVHHRQALTFFLQKQNVGGRYNVALHGFVGSTCDISFQEKWPYQSSGRLNATH